MPRDEDAPQPVAPGAITALLQQLVGSDDTGEGWARALRPGAVVGRFELVRELGRGGFGVVYEARDRALGRPVAFKAVVAGPREAGRRDRLLQEAEAAARLSHPNIVTLFDVGRSEHGPYLVLELLRGETLGRRLALDAMTAREAVRIAIEVARGLAHAHARGVVHRDLTPGNVFLCEDGQVKVLDLGMAHAFGRRKLEGGTRGFMAPEQERGAPEDERTDVFALGAILHRMLAGDRASPVAGSLADAPPLHLPEAPALAELVARMLARDPVERPRDAGVVASALEALQPALAHAPGAPAPHVPAPRPAAAASSVAVLPFADLTPGRDREWLCDGIAEEILHVLGGLAGLRVASRSASFQFKGRAVDAREMARVIGVTTLLEGSVRTSGARVRITARLVDEDGYERWSRTFDRVLEDVFAVQDEIAQAVASALEVRLTSGEARRLARTGTRDARALERYLRARRLRFPSTAEHVRLARDLLQEAIALDRGFAEAHAALADADFSLLQWHFLDQRGDELRREALAASEEALRLDPSLAEAHVARANLMSLAGRPAEAEEEFRRATALNPGLATAWYFQGRFFLAAGRMAAGALALEEAARCDPEDYNAVTLLPQAYRALGDRAREASAVQRAAVVSDRWARLNPDDVRALYCAGGNMVRSGEVERGLALVERALELEPEDFGVLYNSACTYALAGDADRALELLERALRTGGGYRSWIEHDSDLEALRRDPRFEAILARLPP
jgi:TolB-like protein/Tfp pilus assembly protein PilF